LFNILQEIGVSMSDLQLTNLSIPDPAEVLNPPPYTNSLSLADIEIIGDRLRAN